MPHFCAEPDCGAKYDEERFQSTPVDERQCPVCGSGRIRAEVIVTDTIRLSASFGTPLISMSTLLWWTWGKIAIGHLAEAREARHLAVAAAAGERSDFLATEFAAALEGVPAAARTLDALYASPVVPADVREAVATDLRARASPRRPERAELVNEGLNRRFGPADDHGRTAGDLRWLFRLRNDALHAGEEIRPAAPHPLGGNVSWEFATYTVEAAERAVDVALGVVRWCVDHPRDELPEVEQWALTYRPQLEDLERLRAALDEKDQPAE